MLSLYVSLSAVWIWCVKMFSVCLNLCWFPYLAVPGLSRGTWNLPSSLLHAGSLVGMWTVNSGRWDLDQGSTLGLLCWECAVLATGPPGKSQDVLFRIYLSCLGFSEFLGLWFNKLHYFGELAHALFSVIPSFLSLVSCSSSYTCGRLFHIVPELLDILFSHSSFCHFVFQELLLTCFSITNSSLSHF